MSDLNTRVRKGHYGWEAETIVPLGFFIEDKPAELRLTTMKGGNGAIRTIGAVQTHDDGFVTLRLYRDYHATVLSNHGRATEKAVTSQHDVALRDLETIKSNALFHHREKGDLT